MTEVVRGVDFGTSTSLVSELRAPGPVIVPIGTVDPWIPTLVGKAGDIWRTGEAAAVLPQNQIIRSIKRAITDDWATLAVFNGESRVDVDADEAIVEVLRDLVRTADDAFVSLAEVGSVRLGCPAMWSGAQRRRLITLANRAGLAVGDSTLIDEPIAAGVAWVNDRLRRGEIISGKVLVFDIGGGTLDVAVIDVDGQAGRDVSISVQSAVGSPNAGDALDDLIIDELMQKYVDQGVILVSRAQRTELRGRLKQASGQLKVELSTELDVPVIIVVPGLELPVITYSREELETAFRPLLDKSLETVWWALRAALMSQVASRIDSRQLRPSQARALSTEQLADGIRYVLLAGGMANIPAVQNELGRHFGADKIYVGANNRPTDTIVAGLGEAGIYERLNLHRPGFSFVLSWHDSDRRETIEHVIYDAYEPLYTQDTVINKDSVKYVWQPQHGVLPLSGSGELSVRSVSGQRIEFKHQHSVGDSLPVSFGRGQFVLTLEPNGRVFYRDSSGRERSMRIAQWPVIRGLGHEAIRIVDLEEEMKKVPELVWHQKPYD